MPKLNVFNVSEIAAGLEEPFSMVNVAYVDDLLVSVYICEGTLQWHRHVDIDELFWVYEGAMVLESERGDVPLGPDELTIVPKGTRHRSSSAARATVLLLRCGLLPHRKNGKRQLYATDITGLPHIDVRKVARALASPFRFQTIARIESSRVQLARGSGRWPIELPVAHDRLVYVVEGSLTVRTVRDRLRLGPGDLTVVPRGAFYHLYTDENTLLVRVTREAL
jgi:mannose-6-phosphate isomerase-like protein (cupin superfamily)